MSILRSLLFLKLAYDLGTLYLWNFQNSLNPKTVHLFSDLFCFLNCRPLVPKICPSLLGSPFPKLSSYAGDFRLFSPSPATKRATFCFHAAIFFFQLFSRVVHNFVDLCKTRETITLFCRHVVYICDVHRMRRNNSRTSGTPWASRAIRRESIFWPGIHQPFPPKRTVSWEDGLQFITRGWLLLTREWIIYLPKRWLISHERMGLFT